jgi:hypothetical protein
VPQAPDFLLQEAVPGNIRRAEHFIAFMKKVVEHLKSLLRVDSTTKQSPLAFLHTCVPCWAGWEGRVDEWRNGGGGRDGLFTVG